MRTIRGASSLPAAGGMAGRARLLLCLVGLLALSACDESGPSGLDGGMIIFQGSVVTLGATVHTFTLEDSVIMQIQFTDIDPVLIDVTGQPDLEISLGLGVGSPADDGSCATTFSARVREDELVVFSLGARQHCIRVFDAGVLPQDALVNYTLVLEEDE